MPVILVLLAAVFLAHFGWLLAACAAAAAVGRVIGGWLARRDDRHLERRRRDAELAARADRQHAAALAGDELVGIYGDYPPSMLDWT
jgi:MFS family permease